MCRSSSLELAATMGREPPGCDGLVSSSGTQMPDSRLSRYWSVRCRLPAGRMSMVLSGPGDDLDWLSDKGRNDARSWTIHTWRS
jgi:hypothetical protein